MFLTRRLIFLPLLLLLSCQPEAGKQPSTPRHSPFFDLRAYFDGEIKRLQEQQPPVRKTVSIDGKPETRLLDSLRYEDELQPFLASDINRPSWWDKYTIDSTFSGGRLTSIRYQAQDSSLRIRNLLVDWQDGQVSRIRIERFSDSFTAIISQQLDYQPSKGYQLSTRQEVVLSKPKEMGIEVSFR